MQALKIMVITLIVISQCLLVSAQTVLVDGQGPTREAALHDAMRQAVEQAVGTLIDSQTLVQNNMVLKDEIYAKSQGYIRDYTIISEKEANGVFTLQAHVTVDSQPNSTLMTKLQRLKLIDMGLRDPRIGVVIKEYYIRPISDSAAETAVIDQLAEAGFRRIVDPDSLAQIRQSDTVKAIIQGDSQTALLMMLKDRMDYLIVGEGFAEYAGRDMGGSIISCRARVEARMIKVDTGEIIAAQGFQLGGIDITELTAAKKSLNNAGKAAGKYFAEKLLTYAANPEKGVQIKVMGVNDYSIVNLLNRSIKQQTGIANVFLRDFQQGVAMLDVNYTGSPTVLAEQLEAMPQLPIKVIEVSNNCITISLK
ncbi:hypothetical protein SDC9_03966 [bioreactor metagenome]|uniref:Flagellar assembly protein T N-terminal domain-containing protein n=1 Tax=bioreactor metagenome TaxID=1076179 RepID=A0A644SUZ8_9ZZZZ|nr:hypothetical protein [Negativicutes bacterium]